MISKYGDFLSFHVAGLSPLPPFLSLPFCNPRPHFFTSRVYSVSLFSASLVVQRIYGLELYQVTGGIASRLLCCDCISILLPSLLLCRHVGDKEGQTRRANSLIVSYQRGSTKRPEQLSLRLAMTQVCGYL